MEGSATTSNMRLPSRSVRRFYNKRGTAEQWIREGKQATNWTRPLQVEGYTRQSEGGLPMGTSLATTYKLLGLLLLGTLVASAVPVIGPPVNQANFFPPELRQYGIARGAMFAVFGRDMGPVDLVIVSQFPIPTEMARTSAQVTVNGETLDCLMVFTSAGQLAAILPSDTPLGDGGLTVTFNGETSEPAPIRVVDNAVGIFTLRQDGGGPGVYTDANFSVNGIVNAFAPDTVAIAWVTGLGARSPDDRPVVQDLKSQLDLEVSVGGRPARVIYAGPSGCCAAVDQIIFEIPEGREGCFVPVAIRVDDSVSNFASMSISSEGTTCSDPHGFSAEQIEQMRDQGTLTVASVVISKFFPTFSQVPSPQVQALSGGGATQQTTVFDFDGGGVNQVRFFVDQFTLEDYALSGDPIALNTSSWGWSLKDTVAMESGFASQRLEVTGQLGIDFELDGITDLTLSANTDFTATFDSPGLDRPSDWALAPLDIRVQDGTIPNLNFFTHRSPPKDPWGWDGSNAEEIADFWNQLFSGENSSVLETTAFKVNPPPGSPSQDMLVQGGGEYIGTASNLPKRLSQRWQSTAFFKEAAEEFERPIDPNVAAHFPDTAQPGVGRAFVRMTDLENPKILVPDPNTPVDYIFLLEDSAIIRHYIEIFIADLNGEFLDTGSQSQGVCNFSRGANSIDFVCSHNVPNATAFTLNDTSGSESTEVFRLPLNGESTFSGSFIEFHSLLTHHVKVHSLRLPGGDIGAFIFPETKNYSFNF